MMQQVERKVATDIVTLFRSQKKQLGDVCLQSIKVSLPKGYDADEVSNYIVINYPQYKAHAKKQQGKRVLAIGYKNFSEKRYQIKPVREMAMDIVTLFQSQIQKVNDVQLLGIKVSLPEGCDADEISRFIITNYPQYQAHSKDDKENSMLSIGYKK